MPDYTQLITSEHNQKPKYTAMVQAVAGAFSDNYDLLQSMPGQFDLDAAVGAQLDAVGLWVGLSRRISTPLLVYFSLDTIGLGFDQGNWKGPFDPSDGITTLDDGTYRVMLKAKIGANQWDGTLPAMSVILNQAFAGTGTYAFVIDNQDMSLDIYLAGSTPPAIMQSLLKGGYLPLKPAGVRINTYTVTTATGPLFGFDVENQFISGFDVGAWGTPL